MSEINDSSTNGNGDGNGKVARKKVRRSHAGGTHAGGTTPSAQPLSSASGRKSQTGTAPGSHCGVAVNVTGSPGSAGEGAATTLTPVHALPIA